MLTKHRIISAFILSIFLGSVFASPIISFAEEELLHNDARASEARVLVSKGKSFMKKAEREKRWNKGRAYENFRAAEKEFDKAAKMYSQIGEKYDLNVDHELEMCEDLAKDAAREMGKKRSKFKRYY